MAKREELISKFESITPEERQELMSEARETIRVLEEINAYERLAESELVPLKEINYGDEIVLHGPMFARTLNLSVFEKGSSLTFKNEEGKLAVFVRGYSDQLIDFILAEFKPFTLTFTTNRNGIEENLVLSVKRTPYHPNSNFYAGKSFTINKISE